MTTRPVRRRLSREARRRQLLDAAEELLTAEGSEALTMERLARYAGVSKALPYSHFENSDEVLAAVHGRVMARLGAAIVAALEAAPPTRRAEAVVAAYFDAVAAMGPVLAVLTAPGSRPARLAEDRGAPGVPFAARLLVEHFDVDPTRAVAAARVVLAGLLGAVRAWTAGDASREVAEELAVAVVDAVTGGGSRCAPPPRT